MSDSAYLVNLVVEGIQKYIFETHKLKEMIGGSAIVNYIGAARFYDPLLDSLGLEKSAGMSPDENRCILVEANAGRLTLIVFRRDLAENFLLRASRELLARFPGLPFYTAITEFAWSADRAGRDEYSRAREESIKKIAGQRNENPVPCGSPLLPILRVARLDGLPAAGRDKEPYSLPSGARRSQEMLDFSRGELKKMVQAPEGVKLVWEEDLEKMLPEGEGKVALICMDGNDLGKLFNRKLEETSKSSLSQSFAALRELSENIHECGREAFNFACQKIIEYETRLLPRDKPGETPAILVMPLRPLVMGGDDITLITRADIALPFVKWFTEKFVEKGRKFALSLGIGMVVMPASYPFAKAFPLAESLQSSAKRLTRHLEPGERPSSIDYLVLTEDVEQDMQAVRQRLFKSSSGFLLTAKPFELCGDSLEKMVETGYRVLTELPRSQIRQAWTECRKGQREAKVVWRNLFENISRGLGGRNEKLLDADTFRQIFPGNFFREESGLPRTALGDYLELEHLLPKNPPGRELLLSLIRN